MVQSVAAILPLHRFMASGEENDDTQDAEVLEDYPEISIATVHAIRVGKVAWYPTTQVVQGQTFFNVSKHDSVLTKLTTGRRANRHKGKSNNVISQKRIWHDLYVARREACNEAFAQAQRHAMEAAGEVVAADHKFRAAHDGDQFFVKGGAVELQLGNSRVLTTFAVKGPLFSLGSGNGQAGARSDPEQPRCRDCIAQAEATPKEEGSFNDTTAEEAQFRRP